jgi:hypothetical protein
LATFNLGTLTFAAGLDLSFFLQTRQADNSLVLCLTSDPNNCAFAVETNGGNIAVRMTSCVTSPYYFADSTIANQVDEGWLNFVEVKLSGSSLRVKVNESTAINQTVTLMPECSLPVNKVYLGKLPSAQTSSGRKKRQTQPAQSTLVAYNGVIQACFVRVCVSGGCVCGWVCTWVCAEHSGVIRKKEEADAACAVNARCL